MTTAIDDLKAEAKRLRAALAQTGQSVTHSQSLELLAKQRGHRDWNALHAAAARNRPRPPLAVGDRVSGAYLGHRIRAEVIGLSALGDGRFRVKLDLDEPVDVFAFEGMQALRRRISANIRRDGTTVETTSNGVPHLTIDF